MKNFLLVITILLAFSYHTQGQRIDVPTDNPDNGLDLKIVFQEYTVTSHHNNGAVTRQKGKYPMLKVNGVYLPNGNTGVNRTDMKAYLMNCPEALDLGFEGLSSYKKSRWSARLANFGGFGLMITGGLTYSGEQKSLGRTLFATGLATYFGGWIGKKILEKRGHKQVVDAYGLYMDNCYDSTKNVYEYVEDDDVEHGATNEDDEVLIKVLTNNAKTYLAAAGLNGSMSFVEDGFVGYGADAIFYKRGLYAEASALRIHSFSTFSEDLDGLSSANEYHLSASVGIPIISRVKKGGLPLIMRNMQGYMTSGVLDDVGVGTALSVRGGLNRYRQINFSSFDDFKKYASTSTLIRAGLSWSSNTELTFGVDDNRYAEKTRYSLANTIIYLDAVYNLSTKYEIVEENNPFGINIDGTEEPSHKDLGFALGVKATQVGDARLFAKSIKLELGYMPINNAVSGVYGLCTFGLSLYKVNRK